MQIKKISYLDLSSDYRLLRKKILSIMDEICFSGEHVPGKYIEILEKRWPKIFDFITLKMPKINDNHYINENQKKLLQDFCNTTVNLDEEIKKSENFL